jgi:hypothetical protein
MVCALSGDGSASRPNDTTSIAASSDGKTPFNIDIASSSAAALIAPILILISAAGALATSFAAD